MESPHPSFRFENAYRRLPAEFYEVVAPTPLPDPYLVAWNPGAAPLLDLDPDADPAAIVPWVSGNHLLQGMEPLAAVYAGHQFGVWVPQLGDGRAILLGQVRNARGEVWDLQLKGGGQTRYSRFGDGRAVLRSTIREYLASEAMAGLGIPTTRALAIAGSDLPVYRETPETAATLLRLAPTHVRFGTFQYVASLGRTDLVTVLARYVLEHDLGDNRLERAGAVTPDAVAWLLGEVVERTARLVARWMAVGFVHGVLNTDNMSITGLTLDYGPYAFLDAYEPGRITNHSDHAGRYTFGNQPAVGLWNLTRLAEALLGVIDEPRAVAALDRYGPTFETEMLRLLRGKAGLVTEESEDAALLAELLALLQAHQVDYTRFFRVLGEVPAARPLDAAPVRRFLEEAEAFDRWLERYGQRLQREGSRDSVRHAAMARVNPAYVLRTWLGERAIRQAVDERDYGEIERLRALLADPFTEQAGAAEYAESPPPWGRTLVVSCSS